MPRSKKTSKLRVTGLCVGFPHKWPVTRKMFPFDDVIMNNKNPPLYEMYCVSSISDLNTTRAVSLSDATPHDAVDPYFINLQNIIHYMRLRIKCIWKRQLHNFRPLCIGLNVLTEYLLKLFTDWLYEKKWRLSKYFPKLHYTWWIMYMIRILHSVVFCRGWWKDNVTISLRVISVALGASDNETTRKDMNESIRWIW